MPQPMIYFTSIFCIWQEVKFRFIYFLYWFLLELSCHFHQNQLTICAWVYFGTLYSVPLIFMSTILPVACCLNYYSVIIGLKSGSLSPSNFFFFFNMILVILGFFLFHIHFIITWSISIKKAAGILFGIALNL